MEKKYKTMRRLSESVVLWFEWHGGPYIEVGELGDGAKEVINVWDYENGCSVIQQTTEAFNAAVSDWVNEYGADALLHDVVENWRFM